MNTGQLSEGPAALVSHLSSCLRGCGDPEVRLYAVHILERGQSPQCFQKKDQKTQLIQKMAQWVKEKLEEPEASQIPDNSLTARPFDLNNKTGNS